MPYMEAVKIGKAPDSMGFKVTVENGVGLVYTYDHSGEVSTLRIDQTPQYVHAFGAGVGEESLQILETVQEVKDYAAEIGSIIGDLRDVIADTIPYPSCVGYETFVVSDDGGT